MISIYRSFIGLIASFIIALLISYGMDVAVVDGLSIAPIIICAISGSVIVLHKSGKWRTLYICVSGLLAALGGGAIRDLMFLTYPFFIKYPQYIIISVMIGLMIASLKSVDRRTLHVIDSADWAALGFLAVVGAEKGITIGAGANIGAISFIAFFAAFLTGAGGGLVRDLFLLRRLPIAVTTSYGLSAGIGGFLYCHLISVNAIYPEINWIVTVIFVFAINYYTQTYRLTLT